MEIRRGVIWKRFESGLPQGRPSLFVCKCVFVRVCIPAFVCVSRVCRAPSPGTSAMPPLSQFLTSVLKKKHVDSDKTSPLSSAPHVPPGDGLEETRVHHPQPGCLISHSFFIIFYPKLYFTIPNHLFPPTDFHGRWRGKLSIGAGWSLPVSSVFLYYTANVGSPEKRQLHQHMALANKRRHS